MEQRLSHDGAAEPPDEPLTPRPEQRRGVPSAALVVAGYALVVLVGWLLPGSPPRGEGGALVPHRCRRASWRCCSRLAIFVPPFSVVWTVILGVFYALRLPLGPGAGIFPP